MGDNECGNDEKESCILHVACVLMKQSEQVMMSLCDTR